MSYVHDDQYASLLGRGVRDRAVLFGRSCGAEMSILGEYLQRVKAERDEAVKLLRQARTDVILHRPDAKIVYEIETFLSRYDLPDDYDEA